MYECMFACLCVCKQYVSRYAISETWDKFNAHFFYFSYSLKIDKYTVKRFRQPNRESHKEAWAESNAAILRIIVLKSVSGLA